MTSTPVLTGAGWTGAPASGMESFTVVGMPVEVHCHGMGPVDFSDFDKLDLEALERAAAAEGVACIPTVYVARQQLPSFVAFLRRFTAMRAAGRLPHVPLVAMEGPLLASHGGTPADTVFPPTRQEWELIAGCGELGLAYVVLSPDALTPDSDLHPQLTQDHPGLDWIVQTLVQGGVRPALGHYTKADPRRAAELTTQAVEAAWSAAWPGRGARVVTDHLFNDMPLRIRHAFRTRKARAARDETLAGYDIPSWSLDNAADRIGPVPAAIMQLANAGRVAACINFDGEHVDLAIARRAVELIGPGRVMLMTDRCDSARLGGQDLHQESENSLWYQDEGVVAAGSQPLDRQVANVRTAGLPEDRVWDLSVFAAYAAFGLEDDPRIGAGRALSQVTLDGSGRSHRRSVVMAEPSVRSGSRPDREERRHHVA